MNLTNNLNKNAERYRKAHHRKNIWYRIISILAMVTVFVTTYALILPAITKEPSPGIKLARSFVYENEEIVITFDVDGRAVLENAATEVDNLSSDKIDLKVTPLKEGDPAYDSYLKYAESNIGTKDLYKVMALSLHFTHDGEKLDMSNCKIEARIDSKEELFRTEKGNLVGDLMMSHDSIPINYGSSEAPLEESENGDTVIAFSSIDTVSSDVSELDTVYLAEGEGELSLSTTVNEKSDTMAFALYSTINPKYTVQYYSHITAFNSTGDVAIDVIDTTGGILPKNGITPPTLKAYLNYNSSANAYVMAMHQELAPLYAQKEYEYISAPGVAYIDRNRENGNFALDEVWVLKAGKEPDSTNKSDWTVYPSTVSFTNREASAGTGRIYIRDDTVIRLIYDEIDGSYTSGANFYDYDITDGDIHNSNGTKYNTSSQNNNLWAAQTQGQGINNPANYSGSGTKLAFGNVNTGTGLGTVLWTDPNGKVTAPNMYNRVNGTTMGFDGCTFGLVTGMNPDGTLKYANGITAPVLFGYGEAIGKTMLHGYSLQFNRTGDTYVLTAINGTKTRNLEYFTNPTYKNASGNTVLHDHIFTNNFWPMDYSPTFGANGHDLKFGNALLLDKRQYFATNDTFDTRGNLPVADDGVDHNSYFGMNYEVEFTLTEDYRGHLEYIFYGDDDMWVFLDGKLVCDIGGVHSSVGQYVNLWDYINKLPENERYTKHTLSFYYTERGASGSTCYMQFTLPSVSVDTPQIESNTLEIEKAVEGLDTEMEFEFRVELFDQNGNALADDYSYTLYGSDGVSMGDYIINSDENTVYLRNGQYIGIRYLPEGVQYRITEASYSGFHTSYKIGGGDITEGYAASGVLREDTKVLFINATSARLPDTGGGGIWIYLMPLAAAVIFAAVSPIIVVRFDKNRRRETE